jgi:hypothetical protein
MTNRRIWTVEEWKSFTAKCRVVRDELSDLVEHFPETNGITAKIVDGFHKVEMDLFNAMRKLENLIVDQHPDLDDQVTGIVHHPERRGGSKRHACGTRKSPNLTREQWQAIGDKLKLARAEMHSLAIELQSASGSSRPHVNRFIKIGELGTIRCMLDAVARAQHPDWEEATRVFYGSR